MQRYYILLKATGAGGWPGWLPYRLDADSAEQAGCGQRRTGC